MQRRTAFGIMLTLLTIGMLTLVFNIQPVKAEPTTWYVDDDGGADFTKIQDAINGANPGDTIFVYSGTYNEHLTVDKNDLSLIGENRETTIIDGGSEDFATMVEIAGNNTVLSGFTITVTGLFSQQILVSEAVDIVIADNNITGHEYGIRVNSSTNITLTGNIIIGCDLSIILANSSHVSVTENNIERFVYDRHSGIYLCNSFNNSVTGNNITDIAVGIDFIGSSNNTIAENRITGYWDSFINQYNGMGIRMTASIIENCSSYNTFSDNDMRNLGSAIAALVHEEVEGHHNNVFLRNNITNSGYVGIHFQNSSSNLFCHNNFIDNKNHVISEESTNTWDDGYPSGGNYWDDYTGVDANNDGIGDTSYVIDANNQDLYPLMNPRTPSVPPTSDVKIGVKAGDWIKYDYTVAALPPETPHPEWLKVEILSVEGTTAIVRVTMHMSDGKEPSDTLSVDVVAGGEAFGAFSGFVIPADCKTGDSVYMSGYGNVAIAAETTRSYAGASRTVVYTSFSQDGTQLTYYWDKESGVMMEASVTSASMAATAKATEMNLWEAASSPFWMQWWFYAIVGIVIVALAGVVYFLKKRRPPTTPLPPQSQD